MIEADSKLDINSRVPTPGCMKVCFWKLGLGKAGPLPDQEQIVCLASMEGCDLGGEVPMGHPMFVCGSESK